MLIYNSLDFFFGKRLPSSSVYNEEDRFFRSRFFFNLYKFSIVYALVIILTLLFFGLFSHIFNIYFISIYTYFLDFYVERFGLNIGSYNNNDVVLKFKSIVIEHIVVQVLFIQSIFFFIPPLLFILTYLKFILKLLRLPAAPLSVYLFYFFFKFYRIFYLWVYDIFFAFCYFNFIFLLFYIKYKFALIVYLYFFNIFIIVLLLLLFFSKKL